ncbi:FAM92 protein [Chytriomyces sp. MP71]|nr:FAM92 protein [Chytriomyces sp. MP71]
MHFSIPGLIGGPADGQSHFVHSYIKTTDHHTSKLANCTEGYIRNLERTHKKSVKMGGLIKEYAATEDGEFRDMLGDFGDMLLEKEADRAELIARLQAMCLDPLKMYATLCAKLKDEARTRDAAVSRAQGKQQQLDRAVAREGGNRPRLNQSHMELAGAAREVSVATEALGESVREFEGRKRDVLKGVLSEFLWSEIKYHAKALEILTAHHQKLGDTELAPEHSELVLEKMRKHQPPPSLSPVRNLMGMSPH